MDRDTLHDLLALDLPEHLDALEILLEERGDRLDPRRRAGLHPLLVPLARIDDRAVGFLRWPTPPKGMPLPLVADHGWRLELVARSTDEWLHRELALRDAAGRAEGPLLEAAGSVYSVGDLACTGLPANAYLLTRAGVDHGFFEDLIDGHLARGDAQAALVTADRYARHSPDWARPHACRAAVLDRLGRGEEARDAARGALLLPVWTLATPYADVTRLAQWEHVDSGPYRRLAAREDKPPADRAARLMDAAAVEGGDWDEIRPELAALYAAAELPDVARLVGAS